MVNILVDVKHGQYSNINVHFNKIMKFSYWTISPVSRLQVRQLFDFYKMMGIAYASMNLI